MSTATRRKKKHQQWKGAIANRGLSTRNRKNSMPQAIETVDVTVPLDVAYKTWTKFEDFPKIFSDVKTVTQNADNLTTWTVEIGGVERVFKAQITEQHPDERVAWNSTGGEVDHAGVVTFHRLDDDTTRLTVQLDWEPSGLLEHLGAALGVDNRAIKNQLTKFKDYVENGNADGSGWQGDIPAKS
jgi:uncharacterized membrane protein